MSLNIEIAPDVQELLEEEAASQGRSPSELAAEVLAQFARAERERQRLEDEADVQDAQETLRNLKPGDLLPWEQVKAELDL